jgi:hypothetical protein
LATVLQRPTEPAGYYVERLDDGELACSGRGAQGRHRALYFPQIDDVARGVGYGSTPDEAKAAALSDASP